MLYIIFRLSNTSSSSLPSWVHVEGLITDVCYPLQGGSGVRFRQVARFQNIKFLEEDSQHKLSSYSAYVCAEKILIQWKSIPSTKISLLGPFSMILILQAYLTWKTYVNLRNTKQQIEDTVQSDVANKSCSKN